MLEGLPPTGIMAGLGLVAFGGWSLAIYFARLLYTGKVVPRTAVEDINHDRDEWRAAHRISETARQEERDHNAALTHEVAEPLKDFLQAFRRTAARSEVDER